MDRQLRDHYLRGKRRSHPIGSTPTAVTRKPIVVNLNLPIRGQEGKKRCSGASCVPQAPVSRRTRRLLFLGREVHGCWACAVATVFTLSYSRGQPEDGWKLCASVMLQDPGSVRQARRCPSGLILFFLLM